MVAYGMKHWYQTEEQQYISVCSQALLWQDDIESTTSVHLHHCSDIGIIPANSLVFGTFVSFTEIEDILDFHKDFSVKSISTIHYNGISLHNHLSWNMNATNKQTFPACG